MDKRKVITGLRRKYRYLKPIMDERVARVWAGTEAQALGRGAQHVRQGVARAWLAELTDEQKRRADNRCGALLEVLGYETWAELAHTPCGPGDLPQPRAPQLTSADLLEGGVGDDDTLEFYPF